VFFYNSSLHLLCSLTLASLECVTSGGVQVHFVRVDNFTFFFQVECLFVVFELRLSVFVWEVLLVIREELWVGVAHKAVCATCISDTLITYGQTGI